MNRRTDGSLYEDKAIEFLSNNGFNVLEKNFRCRFGEIDIVGIDGKDLVFVEVKHRNTSKYGSAQEAVGMQKQMTISKVSDFYRVSKKQYQRLQIRYDVIAINGDEIKWIKSAFPYCGGGF